MTANKISVRSFMSGVRKALSICIGNTLIGVNPPMQTTLVQSVRQHRKAEEILAKLAWITFALSSQLAQKPGGSSTKENDKLNPETS
eukprot:4662699-Amphidinium_carterae.1